MVNSTHFLYSHELVKTNAWWRRPELIHGTLETNAPKRLCDPDHSGDPGHSALCLHADDSFDSFVKNLSVFKTFHIMTC